MKEEIIILDMKFLFIEYIIYVLITFWSRYATQLNCIEQRSFALDWDMDTDDEHKLKASLLLHSDLKQTIYTGTRKFFDSFENERVVFIN